MGLSVITSLQNNTPPDLWYHWSVFVSLWWYSICHIWGSIQLVKIRLSPSSGSSSSS